MQIGQEELFRYSRSVGIGGEGLMGLDLSFSLRGSQEVDLVDVVIVCELFIFVLGFSLELWRY